EILRSMGHMETLLSRVVPGRPGRGRVPRQDGPRQSTPSRSARRDAPETAGRPAHDVGPGPTRRPPRPASGYDPCARQRGAPCLPDPLREPTAIGRVRSARRHGQFAAGGPRGLGSQPSRLAVYVMVAIRQPSAVLTRVKRSTPQWLNSPPRQKSYGAQTIAIPSCTRTSVFQIRPSTGTVAFLSAST